MGVSVLSLERRNQYFLIKKLITMVFVKESDFELLLRKLERSQTLNIEPK